MHHSFKVDKRFNVFVKVQHLSSLVKLFVALYPTVFLVAGAAGTTLHESKLAGCYDVVAVAEFVALAIGDLVHELFLI